MIDELDDILNTLHRDRASVLENQIRSIEREIATRRLIGAESNLRLWEDITTLTQEILRLSPHNPQEPDPNERTRHELERERRALHQELNDEVAKTFKDVQELKREERQLLNELTTDKQRYERFTRDYET